MSRSTLFSAPIALAVALVLSACGDDVIFRDRELFNPPPDAQSGFLGYFDVAEKTTTCGNCHVGMQGDWEETGHAEAYAGLVGSGHDQPFCFSCHTVNESGNPIDVAAGWTVVQDSAYRDVQCESCHGPGLTHVTNPDASQPVASIAVDLTADAADGCAECHAGAHHPFAEEWKQSPHAEPVASVISRAAGSSYYEQSCLPCHSGQGALKAWGVDAEFVEKDAPVAEHLGITCAVCHDPHGSANSAQLRFPIDAPSENLNLCMKCHHKRAEPEIEADVLRGPHSPEGPLLLGEGAGWFPDGFEPKIDRIVGSHGTTGNARLCATCHVSSFTVNDEATGEFQFQATGHLFLAIPCVDGSGIPTTDQTCTLTERNWSGCTASGCHSTDVAVRSAYTTATGRITDLVADIDALLALPGPAADRDSRDGIFTIADGAWFNARLGELPGSAIHNPFLIEQLLVASINAVEDRYGVTVPGPNRATLDLQF